MTTRVKLELTMDLETADGKPLNNTQARKSYEDAAHAIQQRLFGEGFLPDDVYVQRWDVKEK